MVVVGWRLGRIIITIQTVRVGIVLGATGLDKDLDLVGNRYSIIVLVLFPFYVLFNPVAAVLARKLGPRPFLAGITLAFGLVVIGFGLVNNWYVRYII